MQLYKNLLFLDVDGVLNSRAWMTENQAAMQAERGNMFHHLNPEAGALLQRTLDEVQDVCIVLSSTWRFNHPPEELKRWFALTGLHAPIVGYTPEILTPEHLKPLRRDLQRGLEIQWWLRTFLPDTYQDACVAILDDDLDMGDLLPCLTQTRFQTGFTELEVPYLLQKFDVTLKESRAAGLNGEITWEHDALAMQRNSHRPGWHRTV